MTFGAMRAGVVPPVSSMLDPVRHNAGRGAAARGTAAGQAEAEVRERLRYWFDRSMSRGTPALIDWLGLASLALVVVVAGLAVLLAPDDVDRDPLRALWLSLLRTL